MAGIAVIACVCASACSNRAVPTDLGTDGVPLGGDAFGADAASFCSGQTTFALNGQRVSISSLTVAVTEYYHAMFPLQGHSTFRITGNLQLSTGEQGMLDVLYNGLDLYNGKGPLAVVGYTGAGYRLVSLYKCQSSLCKDKKLVEELMTQDVKSLEGWFVSNPAKKRLSLCMNVTAQDLATHPNVGTAVLYLNAAEATFKKKVGG